jgi:hypothetical protein
VGHPSTNQHLKWRKEPGNLVDRSGAIRLVLFSFPGEAQNGPSMVTQKAVGEIGSSPQYGNIRALMSRACRNGDMVLESKERQRFLANLAEACREFQGVRRGWKRRDLEGDAKGDPEKIKRARRLRQETTMTWAWIAEHLAMGAGGHAVNHVKANK